MSSCFLWFYTAKKVWFSLAWDWLLYWLICLVISHNEGMYILGCWRYVIQSKLKYQPRNSYKGIESLYLERCCYLDHIYWITDCRFINVMYYRMLNNRIPKQLQIGMSLHIYSKWGIKKNKNKKINLVMASWPCRYDLSNIIVWNYTNQHLKFFFFGQNTSQHVPPQIAPLSDHYVSWIGSKFGRTLKWCWVQFSTIPVCVNFPP